MSERYLWDRSGTPDPDVERLETLLGPLRESDSVREPLQHRHVGLTAGIAAALALAALITFEGPKLSKPSWEVAALSGHLETAKLKSGESLETGGGVRARLRLNSTGEIELEPNSRLRVRYSGHDRQEFSLSRGSLRAFIWSPPGSFSVATPSATAVDLGCIYRLQTDELGKGLVHVDVGWVALEEHGRESFVPARAECRILPGKGPGVPYFPKTSSDLKQFLLAFDREGDLAGLREALEAATEDDGVTLWHLLRRVPDADRSMVLDRWAALLPVPSSVTRLSVVHGDPVAFDALWDSLGYRDADWWRMWKRHRLDR